MTIAITKDDQAHVTISDQAHVTISDHTIVVTITSNVDDVLHVTGDIKMSNFIPCNRHLLVEHQPQEVGEEEPSIVLIPEGVTIAPAYSLVKLLAAAHDCEKFNGETGAMLVVNSNMIEDIVVGKNNFSVILENHVVGLLHPKPWTPDEKV